MFDSIKAWARKHKKCIIVTCSIVAVAGMFAVLIINGKKVTVPVKEPADKIIPEAPKVVKPIETAVESVKAVAPQIVQTDEMATVEVDGVLKTFHRGGFIRQLHEGWHASTAKMVQADKMGIDLKPDETIVNPCTVTRRVA